MGWVTTTGRLLRRAARPLQSGWLDLASALAMLGVTVVVGSWSSWLVAGLVGLALVTVLILWAALGLQREVDEFMRPRFTTELALEDQSPIRMALGSGETLNDVVSLYVRVINEGPAGEFNARIANVSGARRINSHQAEVPTGYSVDRVAWMDTSDGRMELSRGEQGTLWVADWGLLTTQASSAPDLAFMFRTAASAAWNPTSHGAGWRLEPIPRGEELGWISFDLEVSNVTQDKHELLHLEMGYDERAHVSFRRRAK